MNLPAVIVFNAVLGVALLGLLAYVCTIPYRLASAKDAAGRVDLPVAEAAAQRAAA